MPAATFAEETSFVEDTAGFVREAMETVNVEEREEGRKNQEEMERCMKTERQKTYSVYPPILP
jgi:hypothetical protein